MPPVNTSSFQLPDSKAVDVVLVRLADGRIVARAAHELVARPTPPAGK